MLKINFVAARVGAKWGGGHLQVIEVASGLFDDMYMYIWRTYGDTYACRDDYCNL